MQMSRVKRNGMVSLLVISVSWAIALSGNLPYSLYGEEPPILSSLATSLYLMVWLAGIISLMNQSRYLLIFVIVKIVEIGVIPLYTVLSYPTVLLIPIIFLLTPYNGIKAFSAYHQSPYLYILLVVQLAFLIILLLKNVMRKKGAG